MKIRELKELLEVIDDDAQVNVSTSAGEAGYELNNARIANGSGQFIVVLSDE